MIGSTVYVLDTNMATYIVSGRSKAARRRFKEESEHATIALSTITQGEIFFGLENKPGAVKLRSAVEEFFGTVQVLPWDTAAAQAYGRLRKSLSISGKSLSSMDMLIAAHAVSRSAVLVTHDRAFLYARPFLDVTDWATDL